MHDPTTDAPVEPRRTLLLVEDDSSLREAMIRALTRAGYEVLAAADGREAVEVGAAVDPAAVIVDVFLPDSGGLGVATALRRRPALERVPLLFTTALALPVVRDALAPAPVLLSRSPRASSSRRWERSRAPTDGCLAPARPRLRRRPAA